MTLSDGIRKLARRGQYGHSRQPRDFYMTEGGCSFYWDNAHTFTSQKEWDRACRLLNRYRRFVAFVEGWKNTGERAYYADNSVMARQVNRQGDDRWICEVAAGGDVCF